MQIVLIDFSFRPLKSFSNFENLKKIKTNDDVNSFLEDYKSGNYNFNHLIFL